MNKIIVTILFCVGLIACTPPSPSVHEGVTSGTHTTTTSGTLEALGNKNARKQAESYLGIMYFSRSALIRQLKFEGFDEAQATYGVDAQHADWNAQAVGKAKNYLSHQAFSHSGLVNQLKFDGFTPEEAEHGVTAAGL